MIMNIDGTTMFHAAYVAFAFACMFFGALAFRQVLDNIAVKKMKMGENRMYVISAPGVFFVAFMFCVSFVVASYTWSIQEPTVYAYALPLILFAQTIQMLLRLYYQRTQVTTLGLIVRPSLFEKQRAVRFEEILHVHVHKELLWITITLYAGNPEPIVFRIFRFSWHSVQRVLQSACTCPVEL